MNTYKVKVGTLALTEARNVNLPQEHAAWYQTVRVEPGTYEVYAYLIWTYDGDGMYRIHEIAAQCEGVTTRCYYGNAERDAARTGKPATAHIRFPRYGLVGEQDALLAQTVLCNALVRTEWDPKEHDPQTTNGRMWRFEWDRTVKFRADEGQARHSGATLTAKIWDSYYTICLTWLPARYATVWHPTGVANSVLAVRTSGAFDTVGEAIAWAKANLDGRPYEIKRMTTDEIKTLSSEDR